MLSLAIRFLPGLERRDERAEQIKRGPWREGA
jgi:hypothetical protein